MIYYGESNDDYSSTDMFKLFIEFAKDCGSSLKNIILQRKIKEKEETKKNKATIEKSDAPTGESRAQKVNASLSIGKKMRKAPSTFADSTISSDNKKSGIVSI